MGFIERLLSYPQRGQVQIDFDRNKRFFRLFVPIFSSVEGLPSKVIDYVSTVKNSSFRPHSTSYHVKGHQVFLIQEIPFAFNATLRSQADAFWQMSQQCHQRLAELS